MREIKFRAWDGEKMRQNVKIDNGKVPSAFASYDWPVMQYTGLKDKNGVEIYEGDLIINYQTGELPNPAGTVDFCYGCWGYDTFHAQHLPLDDIASRSEVIGNIHENPELLK